MPINTENGRGVTDLLNVSPPATETSFAINSFYGQKNKTPKSRKVPFYLRYSQSCTKQKSPRKEIEDISPPEPDSEDTENESPKPVACKRPCYYQSPSEQRKYIASLNSFSHSKKTLENIGIVSPQTPSPHSHSIDMFTKSAEERKFFKNRSASASTASEGGTAVIKRGFNLSFVPRRLSSSFDKKVKRRHSSQPRKKRQYNKNKTAVDEPPLSPLSKVFPELDLDASSTTSSNSGVELSTMTRLGDNPVMLLTPSETNDEASSTTSRSVSSPVVSTLSDAESVSVPSPKMYSIFSNRQKLPGQSCLVPPSESNVLMPRFIKDSEDLRQMTLDAGQKKFGAIQCPQCGMVYTQADPLDETTHAKFHHSVLATLKFPGWKKERVVVEFPELGSRIIMVMPDDQKYALRKVKEINQMMGQELGFPDATLSFCRNYKVFLYISEEKRVDGCCIAESITKGYRVIPNSSITVNTSGRRPWCCQTEPEHAVIGISKIWVYGPSRRNGIASKILDCVRCWFEYGVPVERNQLAFSDPTPDGMLMATKYTGTPAFLVYKCRL